VAVIIAALAGVSSFIDWNNYKPMIESKVGEAINRKVAIKGSISGVIMPMAIITVRDVHIANIEGAKYEDFVSVEELQVTANPLSLLSGVIDISSVKLKKPTINAEKMSDTKASWTGLGPQEQPGQPPEKSVPASKETARALSIGSVEIEDGLVRYIDHTNQSEQIIQDVNFDIKPDFAKPSFKAKGKLTYNQDPVEIDANLGPGKGNLEANLSVKSKIADISFKGFTNDFSKDKTVKGQGDFKAALTLPQMPKTNLKGYVTFNEKVVALTDTTFSVDDVAGSLKATAAIGGEIPKVDANIAFDTLDVNKLMSLASKTGGDAPVKAGKKVEAKETTLPFTGSVNLTAKKVQWNDLAATNFVTDIDIPTTKSATIKQVKADLPAESKFTFNGVVNIPNKSVEGPLTFNTTNLPALAKQFGQDIAWLATQSKDLNLTGYVKADAARSTLGSMQVTNGTTRASGDVSLETVNKKLGLSNFQITSPSIKSLSGKPIAADGKFLAKANITTLASDPMANLNGTTYFEAKDGYIQGIDLPKISARLKQLNNLKDFVGLVEVAKDREAKSAFESLSSTWNFTNGQGRSDDIKMLSAAATGRGNGTVNMKEQSMDITSMMKLTEHPKAPELGVRVYGAFTSPQYDVKTAALESYLTQKAAGKLIENLGDKDSKLGKALGNNKAGKVLNKLFGQ
jgi:uncharacterized protein involved in outer membrane biogenesis